MTDIAERRIQDYEARLRRIDELLARARRGVEEHPDGERHTPDLDAARRERDRLAGVLERMRLEHPGDWNEEIEKAGPMGAWDALALQVERLLEKLGV